MFSQPHAETTARRRPRGAPRGTTTAPRAGSPRAKSPAALAPGPCALPPGTTSGPAAPAPRPTHESPDRRGGADTSHDSRLFRSSVFSLSVVCGLYNANKTHESRWNADASSLETRCSVTRHSLYAAALGNNPNVITLSAITLMNDGTVMSIQWGSRMLAGGGSTRLRGSELRLGRGQAALLGAGGSAVHCTPCARAGAHSGAGAARIRAPHGHAERHGLAGVPAAPRVSLVA